MAASHERAMLAAVSADGHRHRPIRAGCTREARPERPGDDRALAGGL